MQTSSAEIGGKTYREALDYSTSTARQMLKNMTTNDAPYMLTMKQVPFRILEEENGAHFFCTCFNQEK